MMILKRLSPSYDAVIVGARPAGAGTALLLARQGLRVLMIDRGVYGTDTLSTHALMRAGVLQLARWGVLSRITAEGTPPVRSATFVYGGDAVQVPVKPRDGVDALYAPRRTVLDPALVDAATDAGVDVAYRTTLVDIAKTPGGRVSGVVVRDEAGRTTRIGAGIVMGADGMRSSVARLAGAEITRRGSASAASIYGYWSGVDVDGYHWFYDSGVSAGAIPTNGGLTCIFGSVPTTQFADVFDADLERGYTRVLAAAAPRLADQLRGARREGRLHGWPGQPGFLRRATGPGWALVGDAAYFKDPLTAHGITDALVEAEYLARAIAAGTDAALEDYSVDRDARADTIFDVTDRIASFTWTLDDLRLLHKRLAQAMSEEVAGLHTTTGEEVAV